jgi:DNA polymerase III epsilon subunit-like protein
MSTLPTYPWFDQAPDNLKTRRQLGELGLRPGGPVVAQVVWHRGDRWADLYDLHVAKPKREMTPAQAAALEKARDAQRTCPNCKTILGFTLPGRWDPFRDCPVCEPAARAADRADAARLAGIWVRSPRTLVLDTETTDLDGYLVQLAVIRACDGAVLLDTLVNPEAPISAGAQRVHGLTEADLKDAPTFAQIADEVLAVLRGRRVVTYNAAFDRGILDNEVVRLAGGWNVRYAYHAAREVFRRPRWRCAMELYAQFYGDWSERHGDYRWQPLPGGDHTALGDARATRDLLQWMADRPRFEDELKEEQSHA